MKRVYSGVVAAGLCLAMMGSFTGCGEVKAYKTEHEFSDTKISSIKELFFEDKVSPEKDLKISVYMKILIKILLSTRQQEMCKLHLKMLRMRILMRIMANAY